jgi:hypothetical protein
MLQYLLVVCVEDKKNTCRLSKSQHLRYIYKFGDMQYNYSVNISICK